MPLSWECLGGTVVSIFILYFLLSYIQRSKKKEVKGMVVLITGASSGLGEACAKVFYQHGCQMILAGRSEERLQKVKQSMLQCKAAKEGQEPAVLLLDLEDLQSLPKRAEEAVALFGHVDVLISNAGISYRGCISQTSIEVDQTLMNVNYFGQVAFIKALLPSMLSRNVGHIVGVSSIQGKISIPYRSAYSASKHALQAFFDCLRAELGDTGIGLSLVSPGYIRTNLSRNAVRGDGSTHGVMDKATESGMAPEEVAELVLKAVKYGQPDVLIAPFTHRAIVILRAIAPSLFFYIMAKRAKKQQRDYVKTD